MNGLNPTFHATYMHFVSMVLNQMLCLSIAINNYHIYADDIQLYVSFKPNQADALHALGQLKMQWKMFIHGWTLIL